MLDIAQDLQTSLPAVANLFGVTSVAWGLSAFIAGRVQPADAGAVVRVRQVGRPEWTDVGPVDGAFRVGPVPPGALPGSRTEPRRAGWRGTSGSLTSNTRT